MALDDVLAADGEPGNDVTMAEAPAAAGPLPPTPAPPATRDMTPDPSPAAARAPAVKQAQPIPRNGSEEDGPAPAGKDAGEELPSAPAPTPAGQPLLPAPVPTGMEWMHPTAPAPASTAEENEETPSPLDRGMDEGLPPAPAPTAAAQPRPGGREEGLSASAVAFAKGLASAKASVPAEQPPPPDGGEQPASLVNDLGDNPGPAPIPLPAARSSLRQGNGQLPPRDRPAEDPSSTPLRTQGAQPPLTMADDETKTNEPERPATPADAVPIPAISPTLPAPPNPTSAHAPSPDRSPAPAPSRVEPQPAPRTPPAAQLAPAIVTLSAPVRPGLPETLVIRLDPAELGHVQLRIARTKDGPARIELVVERADTLMTLLQDRPRLDQMLDQAGIPPEGRTMQFSLATGDGSPRGQPDSRARDDAPGPRPSPGDGSHDGPRDRSRPPARRFRAGIDITA